MRFITEGRLENLLMNQVSLTKSRKGLEDFPQEYQVIGRDGLGDILAVASNGKVYCFAHGCGHWETKTLAFENIDRVKEYVSFQRKFNISDKADAKELKQQLKEIRELKKRCGKSPYYVEELASVIEDIKDRLDDIKWAKSKKGKSVDERQKFGAECEAILRADGGNGGVLIRASGTTPSSVVVFGQFDPPWTEQRIKEIVMDKSKGRYDLVFQLKPAK